MATEHDPNWPPEPKITINGKELGVGEAMTVRVALQTFWLHLEPEDADAVALYEGYRACIQSINKKMHIG